MGTPHKTGGGGKGRSGNPSYSGPKAAGRGTATRMKAAGDVREMRRLKAKLKALGPEPHKPSPERRAFGTNGRANANPTHVAEYDARVKQYNSYQRKYLAIHKQSVIAGNAYYYAKRGL